MVRDSKRKAVEAAATRLATQGRSTDEEGGSDYGEDTESEDGGIVPPSPACNDTLNMYICRASAKATENDGERAVEPYQSRS